MIAYLSRDTDGKGLLTSKPPVLAEVDGTGRDAFYVAEGDALGIRHLCKAGLHAMGFGDLPRRGTVRVNLSITPAPEEPIDGPNA